MKISLICIDMMHVSLPSAYLRVHSYLYDIHDAIHVILVNPKLSCVINIGRQLSTLESVRGEPCQISSFIAHASASIIA